LSFLILLKLEIAEFVLISDISRIVMYQILQIQRY
jgi:hypothetical protein